MAATPETADSDVMANVKYKKFAYWTWIQASFFHDYRTIGPTLGNLNWQKWVIRDFFLNITYHRQQSSVCFDEIMQFHQRCLVLPVF
jgi:hypothetical protein